MNERWVDTLTAGHRIADRKGLSSALLNAATFYHGAAGEAEDGLDDAAPDTLDEVEEPARKLLEMLSVDLNPLNRLRIIRALLGPSDEPHPAHRIDEVAVKFDEMLDRLDAVRCAARTAHRGRARGRPPGRQDLRAAYGCLAKFWKQEFGEDQFTQAWVETTEGLSPYSDASRFLYDAMKLIDPHRPRVAEELRALMAEDVKTLPGERRGRKLK